MAIQGDRSEAGLVFIHHRGHLIPTSVGSADYETKYGGPRAFSMFPHTVGNIPAGFGHSPDLISNLFTGTPARWWMICERNAIFDVFEQLNSGDTIKLPK